MTAQQAILTLLARRGTDKTICPSEAARLLAAENQAPDDWRPRMEEIRTAAAALASQGQAVVTQRGVTVDALTAEGPIRIGPAST